MPVVRLLKYKGRTDSISGWAQSLGMSIDTLQYRILRGWTVHRAFTTPVRPYIKRPKVERPSAPVTLNAIVKNMQRGDLAQQRELTRMLRQFSRDFEAIMKRSMHRGVVADLPLNAADRSLSSTQERT